MDGSKDFGTYNKQPSKLHGNLHGLNKLDVFFDYGPI